VRTVCRTDEQTYPIAFGHLDGRRLEFEPLRDNLEDLWFRLLSGNCGLEGIRLERGGKESGGSKKKDERDGSHANHARNQATLMPLLEFFALMANYRRGTTMQRAGALRAP